MNLDWLKKPRTLIGLSLALITPASFYFLANGITSLSDGTSAFGNLFHYTDSRLGVLTYVLLFYAFFVKRDAIWKSYFVAIAYLTNLLLFENILNGNWNQVKIVTLLRTLFIQPRGDWPMYSLATIGLIPFTLVFVTVIKDVFVDANQRLAYVLSNLKKLWASALAAAAISGGLLYVYLDTRTIMRTYDVASQSHAKEIYLMHWPFGIIVAAIHLAIYATVITFVFSTTQYWLKEVLELISTLKDLRINTYISRRIGGYIYATYCTVAVTFAVILTPAAAFIGFGVWRSGYSKGFHPLPYIVFPGAVVIAFVVTYLTTLLVRLVIESTVALVHIAENTSSSRSR
jgi:hypothetical protein